MTAKDNEEHLRNLGEVLRWLEEAGMKLNHEIFLWSEVEYLGHVINSKGLRPSQTKIAAITGAPAPTNETELKSFLSLVNYYANFFATVSLYQLLMSIKWQWKSEQEAAFEEVKRFRNHLSYWFTSTVSYLLFGCNTSTYGVGAMLRNAHYFCPWHLPGCSVGLYYLECTSIASST